MKPMKYVVRNRYGTVRYFSSRRAAERYAAAERRDGWVSTVEVI